jgi:hypothetical protein
MDNRPSPQACHRHSCGEYLKSADLAIAGSLLKEGVMSG